MRKTSLGMLTICLLLICAYIFAMFQGGFVSWFLFFTFLPVALCTILLYAYWFKGLHVERKLEKEKVTAGDSLHVKICIYNPRRLPYAYLFLRDHVDAPFLKRRDSFSMVLHPWFKQRMEVEYQIPALPRGVIRWKKVSLSTGDLFGFVQKGKELPLEQEVVVYPRYEEITEWQSWNERNLGSRYSVQNEITDMNSVVGIRDYVPGDRLASVHWKASARSSSLKTKEFEQQVSNDFMFFLDREQVAYPNLFIFERGVSLTASLAKYALDHRFSVGLSSGGQMKTGPLPLSREHDQFYRIMEHLARVEADDSTLFIEQVKQQVNYLLVGTTIVIISPQLKQNLVTMMAELSYRQKKVEFFWLKGDGSITPADRQFLHVLQKERVAYHVIEDDLFNQTLSKGGAGAYAFTSSGST